MAETTPYIEAVGRRKTAVARVRVTEDGKKSLVVNEREFAEYFPTPELQQVALSALKESGLADAFSVSVKVIGGGASSQSEAMRLGIARALVEHDPELRKTLKKIGLLKRDPRVKERKKFGLRGARRAPQWSKR